MNVIRIAYYRIRIRLMTCNGLFTRAYKWYLKKTNPIKYAQKIGVSLGKQCRLNGSPEWGSEPWLIQLGDHTEISFDCAFITHDGSTWVFREEQRYSKVLRFGKIVIGNNCFIGARSTILPGVVIGDDCIVGAGSLVTKNIPAGEIWGGGYQLDISGQQQTLQKSA